MDRREVRAWRLLVGATLVSAAVVVVLASAASWPLVGVSLLAALAGVFAAGFALAAVLRVLAGDPAAGVGNLLAVGGWLLLLAGEQLESSALTAGGVVVVLAAGAYLAWLAVD